MSSNLTSTYSLGDVADVYDGPHATPKKLEQGDAIFLSISSLEQGRLNLEQSSYISEEDYIKWTRRVTPQPGDVVFSYETKIGEASIIPEGLRCCLGRRMGLLRAKRNKVIPDFLLYAYLSPAFQEVIREKTIHGSTTDRLSIKEMPSFKIQIPDVRKQNGIIKILKSIDDKLELNQQVNKTLEQMAQALFKSWFVDFEPVKAKMAVLESGGSQADATLAAMSAISGKDTDALEVFEREHPEQYAELKATAELFPSAMQDSELGDIPEGWYLQRFSNIATLHYGKALKKTERIEGPYSVYGSGGITGSHNSYLVEGPGIIVGRKGSIGTLYWEDGKFHPIDTVYYVENKEGVPLTYLYYLMGTLNLSSMNTDAAVPGLNRDNVYRLETINPEIAILNEFNNHVSALRNMIQRNKSSTETLTQLRDTLLPKLLSGEITLPDAEQAVSEVANV
ncbi:TPA: restriction endonuclease subunit S [Escherichia coli]|uniref:restriction endonuclease subunit S n=1 Tax=Enterobacter roggenkampii TaxID=1812935 RepID=UPI002006715E|nr:restriction endonuclease subunit S [Enterobacter roggenkampii]MBY5092438.1 restriction endonuclease subunit S [Citrobacter freundii]MCK7364825.1 restriction endonuclease subunit S [Enterobacter roggenkampii]MCM7873961.1 restriction endonuclease subunit S [Enterobacter roggenkampii]